MSPPLGILPSLGVYAASLITLALTISDSFIYKSLDVAFVGNSFQYYNDCPRLMEAISDKLIHQNSCMRSAGTLTSIYQYGNGMSTRFNTSNSLKENGEFDLGAPDLKTLFFGDSSSGEEAPNWDFVVMNDKSYFPASEIMRSRSIKALKKFYLPMFREMKAIPVFICSQASINGTASARRFGIDVTNVRAYTLNVKKGCKIYADLLRAGLPYSQSPRIAVVGDAFQLVWEENRDLWEMLFNYDGRHPSPLGTYLQACVLFCTIYKKVPPRSSALPSDPSLLFKDARVMQSQGREQLPTPTLEEATYLYHVAMRVTFNKLRSY